MLELSVIIPNFNHGSLLVRAVLSHIQDDTCARQIVIVDDASTDNSAEVIHELCAKFPQVQAIFRSERGGPNEAIYKGLDTISNEFVMFAAADDVVEKGFAEEALDALNNHKDAGFTFSDPGSIEEESSKNLTVPLSLSPKAKYFSPHEFSDLLSRNYFNIASNTVVYRRELFRSNISFYPELEQHADWFANYALAFTTGCVYRPGNKAKFTISSQSYSSKKNLNTKKQIKLADIYLVILGEKYQSLIPHFRKAKILPFMSPRILPLILSKGVGRELFSFKLLIRIINRRIWQVFRPITPLSLRKWARKLLSRNK